MSDFEDAIMPDDYEAPPQAEEAPQEPTEPEEALTDAEDTKPAEEEPTEPVTPTPQTLKLKFNHEEREISLEEAVALAQKGMNYEKAVERAAQEAKDSVIAGLGYTWNGQTITTEAEYKQALAEKELVEKYQDRDIPEEVIHELMEGRRDREERQKEKAEKEEQTKKDADFADFFKYFQAVNDRSFDPDKDAIPAEVKEAISKGQPLKFAYMEYHNKELRNQLKISKKNEENIRKAPVGSVTVNGGTKTTPEDDFMRGFNSVD